MLNLEEVILEIRLLIWFCNIIIIVLFIDVVNGEGDILILVLFLDVNCVVVSVELLIKICVFFGILIGSVVIFIDVLFLVIVDDIVVVYWSECIIRLVLLLF